jgi:PHD/YefM family antitoxin component YafN of YafNO toxin-antitoxin module
MNTILLENAEKNLKNIIAKTINDNDETVIVSEDGSVVLLTEAEWENVKETLRLFNDKKSLTALLHSHSLRDEGKEPEGRSIEEIFAGY